jgi:hypothetical protein
LASTAIAEPAVSVSSKHPSDSPLQMVNGDMGLTEVRPLWHTEGTPASCHHHHFVDKILKGGTAATILVEQTSTFELTVNLETARAMGLSIQQLLLLRADQVIE